MFFNEETSPALADDSLATSHPLTMTSPIGSLSEVDSMYDSLSCAWESRAAVIDPSPSLVAL